MRNLFTTSALLVVFATCNVHADEKADGCSQIHSLATKVMEVRQLGIELPVLMNLIVNEAGGELEVKIGREIVIDAYEKPQYSLADYQQKEIKRFANEWALKCYKNL